MRSNMRYWIASLTCSVRCRSCHRAEWNVAWILRRGLFFRALRLELFVKSLIRFLFSLAPRPFLIDEPMLRDVGAANLGFRAAALDNLHVSVPCFLIPIFHPKAGSVHNVGQFLGVIRQKRSGFDR